MKLTTLADILGSASAEAALLHLYHYGESYGRAVAADFGVSLDSVQKQLDKFERAGLLICKRQGRTLVYNWNPKSRAASRLRELVAVYMRVFRKRSIRKNCPSAAVTAPRTSRSFIASREVLMRWRVSGR